MPCLLLKKTKDFVPAFIASIVPFLLRQLAMERSANSASSNDILKTYKRGSIGNLLMVAVLPCWRPKANPPWKHLP